MTKVSHWGDLRRQNVLKGNSFPEMHESEELLQRGRSEGRVIHRSIFVVEKRPQ